MKKLLGLLLIITIIISFASCGSNEVEDVTDEFTSDSSNNVEDVIDEFANHKKVLSLIKSYLVTATNGFDYSLEQKLGETVVNAHTITVRLDHTNGTIGSRVEYKKELNEDISKGQYTEMNATVYYNNNQLATYANETWTWNDGTLDNFAALNLKEFAFDFSTLSNLSLETTEEGTTLTFQIDDTKASSFLKVSGSIQNLSFEIKTDATNEKLVSFSMQYSQSLTKTYFNFVPYYGSVSVELPK